MANSKYITKKEVAELIRGDQTTVDRYAKKGYFRKLGIGRKVLFLREEVERALIEL